MKTMQAAAAARAGVRRKNRVMEHWRVYLMMVPAIVYMLLFHYKPIYGVIIAFKDYSFGPGIWGSEWVGLANFARLFKSYWFPVIVKNTFTISLLTLAVTFPLPILLALMASGLNGQSFAFNGYLPVKQPERGRAIRHFEKRAQTERQSQIFIETPYRNLKLFEDFLKECNGNTLLTVAADILQPDQLIRTAQIRDWKAKTPDIHKRPAIFILGV